MNAQCTEVFRRKGHNICNLSSDGSENILCVHMCGEEVNKRVKYQQLVNMGKGYTSVLWAIFATL